MTQPRQMEQSEPTGLFWPMLQLENSDSAADSSSFYLFSSDKFLVTWRYAQQHNVEELLFPYLSDRKKKGRKPGPLEQLNRKIYPSRLDLILIERYYREKEDGEEAHVTNIQSRLEREICSCGGASVRISGMAMRPMTHVSSCCFDKIRKLI